MGCSGSRLNAEGEAIPVKLRPTLRHRIEEIRRRRRSGRGKDTTHCGKELLLNHYGKEKDDDEIENSMASCVTSEDSKGSTATQAEEGDPETEESAKGKKKKGEKEETTTKGNVKGESKNDADKEDIISHDNEEEEDDDHDNEGMDGNEDILIFPASPSFRIYFTDNLDEDDDDKDNFNDGGEYIYSGICRTADYQLGNGKKEICATEKAGRDHGMPPEEDSSTLRDHSELDIQDSEPKKPKKGKKRSFRKVIPKGGQTAMKNLFNVKSCYTPSCSSHDRAHLLTEKVPA